MRVVLPEPAKPVIIVMGMREAMMCCGFILQWYVFSFGMGDLGDFVEPSSLRIFTFDPQNVGHSSDLGLVRRRLLRLSLVMHPGRAPVPKRWYKIC